MSDETTALEVSFAVNIDQLTSASSAIDSIFASVADAAQSSGTDITASLTAAAESFSSISEAASQISVSVEEGVSGAVEALDTIPSASEDVSASFTSLQGAIDALSASVTSAVGEIDTQIESIGTTAEESASTAKSSFEGFDLGGMVTSTGMAIFSLQALGTTATQTANTLLAPAEASENTQASFSNLLGSTKGASDELSKLNQFAAQTQFKTQDIDDAAAKLIAFKTPTQSIIPDLTAVGDALTAIGKGTPAEMSSVVDVLGKMGIAGKITQGDITQLGQHGIDAMSAIEKGSGLSKDALTDMIAKGTLPANDAIKDLTKGIEANPVYSGGMAKQADTLSGQMSTLGSNWDQTLASFGSPIVKTLEGQVGDLSTVISSKSFKDFAGTVGKNVTTAFKDIGQAVQNTGKFFDNPAFKKLADLLGGQLATGVQNLAKFFDSPAFGDFAKTVGVDVGNALLTATQDIEKIVDWTIQWHEPILVVAGVLTGLFIPAIIKSGVESVIAGGKVAVSFITNLVQTGIEGYQAAGKIALWIVQTIASGTQAVIAGAKIVGSWIASVVTSGTQSVIAGGQIALSYVGNLIASGAQAVIAGAKIVASWIAGVVTSGLQAVIAGAQIAGSFIVSVVTAGVEAATTGAIFFAELIPAIISMAAESLIAAATAIPAVIVGFGAWAVSAGIAALATLAVIWPFVLIGLVVGAVVVGIVLAVQHWSQIMSFVGGVVKNVMGGVSKFFGQVGHDIQNIFHNIGQAAQNVGKGIEGAFKGGINGVIKGLNWLIDAVDNFHVSLPPLVVAGVTVFGGVELGLPPIPEIPLMAKGGVVQPGQYAIAGEAGAELVFGGTAGASVMSASSTSAMMNGGGETHVHVHNYIDGREMTTNIMTHAVKIIRSQGGRMVSI